MSATSFKTYIYQVPAELNGVPTGMTGVIHVRKPTIVEKFEYLERCGFEVGEDGQMRSVGTKLRASIEMVKIALPHIEKVDITKANGEKIESPEHLEVEGECEAICFEISGLMLNGFKPSKN
jgi:hypothetical protein